jgi:hypothetical protein
MLEELIAQAINLADGQTSSRIVLGLNWLAQHYNDLLTVVRWTVPCVITSGVLFCLLVPTVELRE